MLAPAEALLELFPNSEPSPKPKPKEPEPAFALLLLELVLLLEAELLLELEPLSNFPCRKLPSPGIPEPELLLELDLEFEAVVLVAAPFAELPL